MDIENDRFRDFLGVTAWHKKGYTGKRCWVASGENWGTDKAEHGWQTWAVFKEFAPDCECGVLTFDGVWDVAFYRVIKGLPTLDVWWASLRGGKISDDMDEKLAQSDCALFMAVGNTNSSKKETASPSIVSPHVFSVSACRLMVGGKLALEPYNYESEYVDFCLPTGIWVCGGRFTGTSCSTPVLAGMAACVNDLAFEQIGRALTRWELYDFLAGLCVPILGNPRLEGLGCPVLPDPDTVDFRKYEGGNALNVIEEKYNWRGGFTSRKTTDAIVLHHAAAVEATAQRIHEIHLGKGWNGIGYHYYVRKDGRIYRGRPEWASGAHVENQNSHLLGVCFEGNFDNETMGQAQLDAGRALIADIHTRYPGIPVKGHRDYMATACPGRNFPMDEMMKEPGEMKEDEDMTGQEIYTRLNEYLRGLAIPDWAKVEYAEAVAAGITDGTRPCELIPRYQAALMALRTKRGKAE